MNIVDLWDMTSCRLVFYYPHFGGIYCLRLPNKWWRQYVPRGWYQTTRLNGDIVYYITVMWLNYLSTQNG